MKPTEHGEVATRDRLPGLAARDGPPRPSDPSATGPPEGETAPREALTAAEIARARRHIAARRRWWEWALVLCLTAAVMAIAVTLFLLLR